MNNIICIHAIVSGKVQGVFYRKNTIKNAKSFNLTGWVKNNLDGTVELIACGKASQIHLLIDWLKQGPPMAQVSDVTWQEIPIENFHDFELR